MRVHGFHPSGTPFQMTKKLTADNRTDRRTKRLTGRDVQRQTDGRMNAVQTASKIDGKGIDLSTSIVFSIFVKVGALSVTAMAP